jgi:hypothetical protein
VALSDLAVFSEYVNTAQTEVLAQQVELFNEASNGAIILRAANHSGDYSDLAFWAKISGLVRRRNAYGTGDVSEKTLAQLVETMVKVAAGTPPVRIDPGMFEWINKNPEEAGAVIGQQLAGDTLADMLNVGLLCAAAALSGVTALYHDADDANLDMADFNSAQALFGDRAGALSAWVMHSKPLFDLYGQAMTNSTGLFNFGNVNVSRDPFGRVFVVSDSPALLTAGTPNVYTTLGLVPGAIRIDQNDDFTDNIATQNGKENIIRSYQAEWSYNVGILGFTWDKTNGGKSPTDSALGTSTNWDKIYTSTKDMAGVVIKSQ